MVDWPIWLISFASTRWLIQISLFFQLLSKIAWFISVSLLLTLQVNFYKWWWGESIFRTKQKISLYLNRCSHVLKYMKECRKILWDKEGKLKETKRWKRRNVKRKSNEKKKKKDPLPSTNDKWQLQWSRFHTSFLRMHCHLPAFKQNASEEKVDLIPTCTVLQLPESPHALYSNFKNKF